MQVMQDAMSDMNTTLDHHIASTLIVLVKLMVLCCMQVMHDARSDMNTTLDRHRAQPGTLHTFGSGTSSPSFSQRSFSSQTASHGGTQPPSDPLLNSAQQDKDGMSVRVEAAAPDGSSKPTVYHIHISPGPGLEGWEVQRRFR